MNMRWGSTEIALLRSQLGLTLKAFSELVGVSEATACRWESGGHHPRFETMGRLDEIARENNITFGQLQPA